MTERNYNLPSSTKSKGVHISFNEEHVVSSPFENLIKNPNKQPEQISKLNTWTFHLGGREIKYQ